MQELIEFHTGTHSDSTSGVIVDLHSYSTLERREKGEEKLEAERYLPQSIFR